jgi:CRP-like cAMP-binding protein
VAVTKEYEALRGSVLSKELSDDECGVLASSIKLRSLGGGEILCDEGQSDSKLYVVVSGALNVAKREPADGWNTLYTLTHGDLVGELSFMDETPHYAALRAAGPTQVFSLDRRDLEALLEKHPWIAYRVMRAIMRNAHALLRRMSLQSVELQNYIFKQHGKY